MSLTSLRSSQALTNAALAGSLAALRSSGSRRPAPTSPRTSSSSTSTSRTASRSGRTTGTRAGTRSSATASSTTRSRRCRDPAARRAQRRRLDRGVLARHPRRPGESRRSGRPGSSPWSPPPSVVSAAFPYGLGLALALTALVAIARRHVALFGILAALTLAASPLAFLFLLVVLAAAAVSRTRRDIATPAAIAALDLRARPPDLAALPRSRRLPVLAVELARRAGLLRLRHRPHVARRARADPVRALRRLRRRLRPRLPDPVDARRERRPPALHRAAAQRC